MAQNLIPLESFIEKAKNKGIKFGKTDPYNRLRYYTKIGWLPNMIRKSDSEGNITGHYPAWAIERLILIEKLKNQDIPNEEIAKKIEIDNKISGIKAYLVSPQTRNKALIYLMLAGLAFVIANELELIHIGQSKSLLKNLTQITTQNTVQYIIDQGTASINTNQTEVFISNNRVEDGSKILITFSSDYYPASRFWVSRKISGQGFYLNLDQSPAQESTFSWWITK